MNTFTDFCLQVLLLLYGVQLSVSQTDPGYNSASYPNPRSDPQACGQTTASYFCDPTKIISQSDADAMKKLMSDTFDITKGQACENSPTLAKEGFRMSQGIVPRIDGTAGFNKVQHRTVANIFAESLRSSSWKYGSCDNDALLLYVPSSNTIGLAIAKNAQKRIPLDYADNLIDDTLTRINRNNAGPELLKLQQKLKESLTLWSVNRVVTFIWAFILAVVAVAFIIIIIVVCVKCRKRPEAEKAVEKVDEADKEESRKCCWCCRRNDQDEESKIEKLFKAPEEQTGGDNGPAIIPQWAQEKSEEEVSNVKEKAKDKKHTPKETAKEKPRGKPKETQEKPKDKPKETKKEKPKEKPKENPKHKTGEMAKQHQKSAEKPADEEKRRTKLIIKVGEPDVDSPTKVEKPVQNDVPDLGVPDVIVIKPAQPVKPLITVTHGNSTESTSLLDHQQPIMMPISRNVDSNNSFSAFPQTAPITKPMAQQPQVPIYTPMPYRQTQTDSRYSYPMSGTMERIPDDPSSIVTVNDNSGKSRVVIGLDDPNSPMQPQNLGGIFQTNPVPVEATAQPAVPVTVFPVSSQATPEFTNETGGMTVVSVTNDDKDFDEKPFISEKSKDKIKPSRNKKQKKVEEEPSEGSEASTEEGSESDTEMSESNDDDSETAESTDKSEESEENSEESENSQDSNEGSGKSDSEETDSEEDLKKAKEKAKAIKDDKRKKQQKERKTSPKPSTSSKERKASKDRGKQSSSKHKTDGATNKQNLGKAKKWSSKGGFSKKGELDYF